MLAQLSGTLSGPGPDLSHCFPGFDRLASPRVVLDAGILQRNIDAMAMLLGGQARLHPHVKTHKSLEIARLQRQAGAAGFTAARPYEAAMLLRDGLSPVTLAYPLLDPDAIADLLRLATEDGAVRFIADSRETAAALAQGAQLAGCQAAVFLKVDVGLHRCGVDPDGAEAVALAEMIQRHPDLTFAGLLSHAGHGYGAAGAEAVTRVAQAELAIMTDLRQRLVAAGIAVPCVSIGSTPTIVRNAGFEGVDEVRPGNYVFYDLTAVRLGLVGRRDLALGVAARIVAVNDRYAIANVGSKTLSSDLGAHGTSATSTFGEAWSLEREAPLDVAKLSEEHAFLTWSGKRPSIGTAVLILPNHACPVANLSGGMLLLGCPNGNSREIAVEGFVGHHR